MESSIGEIVFGNDRAKAMAFSERLLSIDADSAILIGEIRDLTQDLDPQVRADVRQSLEIMRIESVGTPTAALCELLIDYWECIDVLLRADSSGL